MIHEGTKPRTKYKRRDQKAKRVCIYLYPEDVKIASEITNLSEFFRIALKQAVGIMTFDKLMEARPDKYFMAEKLEDHIDEYNKRHPVDKLTEERRKQWRRNSPQKPEIW